jgi:hypothetical protein
MTAVLCLLTAIALSALAAAVFALFQPRALLRGSAQRAEEDRVAQLAAMDALRSTLDGLAAQVHDLQQSPAPSAAATMQRSGLNLSKRSQALRLHRRGESPEQIAATLDLPLQQIELLIKVHRIVISNI